MDRQDAQSITGMHCREFPDATFEFMRCQIGVIESVKIKLSAHREMNDSVFYLRAFGENWDKALDMLKRLKAST